MSRVAPITAPYPPGWINRLAGLIDRWPGPYWAYYLGLGVALGLAFSGVKWGSGVYPPGSLFAPHLLFAGAAPYTLLICHMMIRAGSAALGRVRRLLPDAAVAGELEYRITRAPALPVLLFSLLGAGWGWLLWRVYLPPLTGPLKLSGSPAADLFETALLIAAWAVIGAGTYQLINQLRAIGRITQAAPVNLFRPQPLYALTGLASRGALSVSLYTLVWALGSPQAASAPAILASVVGMQALAAAAFFGPLLGVHRQLLEEKHRLLEHVGERMQAAVRELQVRADAGEPSALESQLKVLSGLQAEQTLIDKTSTWPWHPETMRLVITAILLPMVVFVIQKLAGRVIPS